MAAQVQVVQHYNPPDVSSCDSEFSYSFPLDNKAAVCGFKLTVDTREVEGKVQEKIKARQEYEQAIDQGKTAAIMEEAQADIFSISLGNVSPNAVEISTTITYLVELKMDLEDIRFFLPTHIGTRYSPPGAPALPVSNPPTAPVTLNLDWNMPSAITSFTSPTHAGMKWNRKNTSHVSATIESITHGDIVVLCKPEKPHEARACLEKSEDGSRVLMVTFVPRLELEEQKCEFVFVIDRSGSMSGQQIQDARAALEVFLRSLPEDCYINIVGFGSRYDVLYEKKSERYSDVSLKQASHYAANMDANFGGTEIMKPLEHIYDTLAPIKGYARQVFVLTDGQVSNTDQVISRVRKQREIDPSTRMFTLGIGSGVSHNLVDGMARVGNGTAAYVTDSDRLAATIIKQLKASHAPAISDVSIDWLHGKKKSLGSSSTESLVKKTKTLLGYITPSKRNSSVNLGGNKKQTPYTCPPIFDGDRFLSYCFLDKDDATPTQVTIHAKIPGIGESGEVTETVLPILEDNTYEDTRIIHTLAARSMIQDLEDGKSYLRFNDYDAARTEIIALGIEHNLVSKFTSYVAIDHSSGKERKSFLPHAAAPAKQHAAPRGGRQMYKKSANNVCYGAPPMMMCSAPPPPPCAPGGGPNMAFGGYSQHPAAPGGGGMVMRSESSMMPQQQQMQSLISSGLVGGISSSKKKSKPKCRKSGTSMKKEKDMSVGAPMPMTILDDIQPKCAMFAPVQGVRVQATLDRSEHQESLLGRSRRSAVSDSSDDDEEDFACEDDAEGEAAECEEFKEHMPAMPAMSPRDKMSALIKMQSFDGSFALTRELLNLVGVSRASLDAALGSSSLTATPDKVLGTTLAIMLMEKELAEFSELQLVLSKAHRWLTAQCKNPSEIMTAAKSAVQSTGSIGGH